MENDTTRIDSYLLIKKISAIVLGLTTFAGAFVVGYVQFDNAILGAITGLFGGFMAYVAIDMLLGAIMSDLIHPNKQPKIKWVLMIGLLFVTGLSSAIVGIFLEEKISEGKTVDQKQDMRTAVLNLHEQKVSDNQKELDRLKREITQIEREYKKDTAAILANMPDYHRRAYEKGTYGVYMKRSGYGSLKMNMNRILDREKEYKNALSQKQAILRRLEAGLSEMRVSDPLTYLNAELESEDAKNAKFGAIVKGMVWVFDIAAVFSLFFSFWFCRISLKNDPSLEIPKNEFHGWVLARWTNLSKKMLDSTEESDNTFQYFSASVAYFFGQWVVLIGWILRALALVPKSISKIGSGKLKLSPDSIKIMGSDDVIESDSPTRPVIQGFHGSTHAHTPAPVSAPAPAHTPARTSARTHARTSAPARTHAPAHARTHARKEVGSTRTHAPAREGWQKDLLDKYKGIAKKNFWKLSIAIKESKTGAKDVDGIKKINYVYFAGDEKKSVWYNIEFVNGRVARYKERADNAKREGKDRVHINNQAWVEYWSERMKEFSN